MLFVGTGKASQMIVEWYFIQYHWGLSTGHGQPPCHV